MNVVIKGAARRVLFKGILLEHLAFVSHQQLADVVVGCTCLRRRQILRTAPCSFLTNRGVPSPYGFKEFILPVHHQPLHSVCERFSQAEGCSEGGNIGALRV